MMLQGLRNLKAVMLSTPSAIAAAGIRRDNTRLGAPNPLRQPFSTFQESST